MRYKKCISIFLINLFLCIFHLQAEGFLADTFVRTPSGYHTVETLATHDPISSYPNDIVPITHINHSFYNSCIKITIQDINLYCAPDQKFYSYNQQQWICAQDLHVTDLLMDDRGNPVAIDAIEIVEQKNLFYALSLKSNHTYCVSSLDIIVHNAGPFVLVLSIPTLVAEVIPVIKTCLAVGGTLLGAHFAKKISKKDVSDSYNSPSTNCDGNSPDPNDPDDEKNNKTHKDKHPHGIYKDAPYHHKNSCNGKSKSPDDGQRCLDYSLPTKTGQRIAIEGDVFVVLRQTIPGEYHGFKVNWEDLHHSLQRVLRKHGFVKQTGKIIKHITEKWPS